MFINETENNLENNIKAVKSTTGAVRLMLVIVGIVVLALGVLFIVLNRVWLGEEDDTSNLILIVFGVLLLVFAAFFSKFQRSSLERTRSGKESHNRFEFNEEGIEILCNINDGSVSTFKGNYNAIVECREEQEFWLIYINKATMYMMLKSGMVEGNAEEFAEYLKMRLGIRYKVKYKKKS